MNILTPTQSEYLCWVKDDARQKVHSGMIPFKFQENSKFVDSWSCFERS